MKKNKITRIANKLGWKFEETKEAIEYLLKNESIIKDWEKFFKICVEAEDPQERWTGVRKEVFSQLPKKDLVETICKWLYQPDPCFSVCALFNVADDRDLNVHSYVHWKGYRLIKRFGGVTKHWPRMFFDPVFDPVSMCDYLLTRLIKEIPDEDRHSIFHNVIAKVGFMAFNITAFRDKATDFTTDPTKDILAKELTMSLKKRYLNNTKNTEKKYWLYYLLVENLKADYGVRGAFREVAKRLDASDKTIQRRYFERKKIAKKKGLSNEDIISEFPLAHTLEGYLNIDTQSSMSVDMSVSEK